MRETGLLAGSVPVPMEDVGFRRVLGILDARIGLRHFQVVLVALDPVGSRYVPA